jgi:hypothetical protein
LEMLNIKLYPIIIVIGYMRRESLCVVFPG